MLKRWSSTIRKCASKDVKNTALAWLQEVDAADHARREAEKKKKEELDAAKKREQEVEEKFKPAADGGAPPGAGDKKDPPKPAKDFPWCCASLEQSHDH